MNTRVGKLTTDALCFSKKRAGSPWAHVTGIKGSGEAVENCKIFSITDLLVGQLWSAEEYLYIAETPGNVFFQHVHFNMDFNVFIIILINDSFTFFFFTNK